MNTKMTSPDHDLLIELKTEMSNVRRDIKDLKDDTINRLKTLEQNYVDKQYLEKRLTETAQTLRAEQENSAKLQQNDIDQIKKIVYGACGLVLVGFIVQLIALANK